jgi:UDP-2-acetamido-3-amino-2,3-dideoxy-glucuronate N-acetyltransferase
MNNHPSGAAASDKILQKQDFIKVAVIGAGYWGKNLVRNFAGLGVLAAICEHHKPTLDEMAKLYPQITREESYRSILANPEINAVAIASPAETHYQMVREALLADKDVFVEKPAISETPNKQTSILSIQY